MFESLGVPESRIDEILDVMHKQMEKCVRVATLISKTSEVCESPEELVLAGFLIGAATH